MDNLNLVVGLPLYYISWVWAFSSENTLFIFNKYINTIAILCSMTDISRITYTCFFVIKRHCTTVRDISLRRGVMWYIVT